MRLRWAVLSVFVVSGALNYLDRQLLPALAPALRGEFHLSNQQYGLLLAAFSIAYAIAAPLAGLFVDRAGLSRGTSAVVGLWSAAGIATGLAGSFGGLLACRGALGVAQAGGVPSSGKAIATYLPPEERALGNAVSQIGLGVGAMLAPPAGVWLAMHYGWRAAFLVTGAASLLWIPLWNMVARHAPRIEYASLKPHLDLAALFRDRQLWSLIAANVLTMTVYTLWSNWTTVFLVERHHLTLARTAAFAWLPPLFVNLGGLAGGWLSLRWMRQGTAPTSARLRACLVSAVAMLVTAAVPLMPGAALAIAAICFSSFWAAASSVNLYTIPLDIYGARRAAFTVSTLTAAYGAMQALFSPLAGRMIDAHGFGPVCALVASLPLLGWGVLEVGRRSGAHTALRASSEKTAVRKNELT
jgi:ACS family hexuronate transporter-like MFS transporter